ncbi:Fic family protein [Luteibaculum oceani]|nr:Fic family protein [Luteibaculum oceani]
MSDLKLSILPKDLFLRYSEVMNFDLVKCLEKAQEFDMPVDYFQFYKSVSSVYSSKIEGENIEFDSFFKHKFLNVRFNPDYTQRADDLYGAYEMIDDAELNEENLKKAHKLITSNILPLNHRGVYRNNPMYVIGDDDRIDYVAASQMKLASEMDTLFKDIQLLLAAELSIEEVFFYAPLIHLVFVKIHPFQDGNGRTARLLEKWFFLQKLGPKATGIQLEKNYYTHLRDYYNNLRKIGLEYESLDYNLALDFVLMTANGLCSAKR